MEQFLRSAMLLGEGSTQLLSTKRVAIFGIGGVGSFAAEALVRSGIGHFLLVDNDTIALTNLNRQIHATHDTIGQLKTQVMAQRMSRINPLVQVETAEVFVLPQNIERVFVGDFDYIIDAVDTVSAKIALVEYATGHGIPIISCMGTGNKLDPTLLVVGDLFSTKVCPLCRIMRKELRRRGIQQLKVVYSEEEPLVPISSVLSTEEREATSGRRGLPGSVSFVPPVAGMITASEVIRDLLRENEGKEILRRS